jgi:elongation factor G
MLREFNVQATVGRPRVAYRETITEVASANVTFDRMLAGKPQYARVVLEVVPTEDGADMRFESDVSTMAFPANLLDATRAGVLESRDSGFLAGYPLVGLVVRLVDARVDDERSTEMAFKAAAAQALRKAIEAASPTLLEPVMDLEVVAPEDFVGDVLGDLNMRGASIQKMKPRPGDVQAVRAYVPLAQMFGYATDLRSGTQGRGTFTMEFDHYEKVDSRKVDKILYGS